MLTIASVGLIPSYSREDLTLVVRVGYGDTFLREDAHGDYVGTWAHLFMIPWAFSHDPVEVQRSVFENMLLHFVRDFRGDLPLLVPAQS